MVADYPDGVKSFAQQTAGVSTMNAADVNEAYDEVESVEASVIAHGRGGLTDLNMVSDPAFAQELNSGLTYITYSAVNDRMDLAILADSTARGVYSILDSVIQVTPDPSAVIELIADFVVTAMDIGSWMIGFKDFATSSITRHFGVWIRHDGANPSIRANIAGSTTQTDIVLLSPLSLSTLYQVRMGWQTHRPLTMTASLWNATTGAQVTAETHQAITTATDKDQALLDFGILGLNTGAAPDTGYIKNMWGRILRV